MNKYDNILETDVLVIGGGFSGTWAAIKAREHVRNVLMVDKGPRDWGGLGSMSGGDMIVKQPEFEASDLVDELTYYYDGLCEQDVLEEILNLSYDRFMDLEGWGTASIARTASCNPCPSAVWKRCATTSTIPMEKAEPTPPKF